jgi:protein phosphatase
MLIVEVHATSHVGRVRKGNEDNYLLLDVPTCEAVTSPQDDTDGTSVESRRYEVTERGVVLAVSDGMGGALAGEVASQLAVDTVSSRFNEPPDGGPTPGSTPDWLVAKLYEATLYANYLIHQQGRSDAQYQGMGATFTGMGISPDSVDLIQVGDSRAYLIRNGKIFQITKDQSLVQQLIDANQITEEEAETHALRNVILQALGAQNEIFPVAARLRPRRGDTILLCSDGLSNKVGGLDLQQIVSENGEDLSEACRELVREANARGGEDNITVVIAKLSGDALTESSDDELELVVLDIANIHDTAEVETGELRF